MRSCLPTLLRVGQAWPTIRFGGYRQFFGFRSPYAGSSVASGRIEFVSPRSRNTTFLRTILSLSVALHEALLARSYFRLLTGSSAREGLSPSCSSALPSAHMPPRRGWGILSVGSCKDFAPDGAAERGLRPAVTGG